jgi:surface antigen
MSVCGKTRAVLSALVAASTAFCTGQAIAHTRHHPMNPIHNGYYHHAYATKSYASRAYAAHVIQCVAFAKWDTGMDITGNARDWWSKAAGVYERGARPEPGSVLSFRPNERMPLGHVAVVSGIEDSRTIIIDQSHWNSRGISRDIEVKDVSEDNDWSAVRVQLGHGGGFGSIYPTHGFIYPRPDQGTLQANLTHAPMPDLDPAPADLRRPEPRHRVTLEVAEAPEPNRPLDLTVPGLSFDAPNRELR